MVSVILLPNGFGETVTDFHFLTANLDFELAEFLRKTFPAEVKAKQKENERESAKEQLEEMGYDTRCIIS